MQRTAADRFGNILALALVIAVNVLSNALPINGQSMPEISARYPSPFTPSGYTFAIWGVIYLLLLGFVVYQALPSRRDDARLAMLRPWFQVNCLANASWLVAWHYDQLVLSFAIMLVLLATLIGIYRILIGRIDEATPLEHVVLYLPFSVYTGWITVATVANLSVLQTAWGFDDAGLSAVDWTLLKLALVGAVGATMVIVRRDIPFGLVIAWAALGIAAKQVATPTIVGAATVLAWLCVLIVARDAWLRIRAR